MTTTPPPVPAGRRFGSVTIGTTTVALLAADRSPTNRGYFLHDYGLLPDAWQRATWETGLGLGDAARWLMHGLPVSLPAAAAANRARHGREADHG